MKEWINSSVLFLYRVFSIISLYAVLVGVLIYTVGAAFYAVSTTWIAPIIVSAVDKDALDLKQRMVLTQGTMDNLILDVERLHRQSQETRDHRASLALLLPQLNDAISRESNYKSYTVGPLRHLESQKVVDNTKTSKMLADLSELNTITEKELAVGLITKTDAIEARSQLVKSSADLTDSRIGAMLLQDNVFEKSAPSTTFLDSLGKRTELISEMTNLDITIAMTNEQITIESKQIHELQSAVDTAKQSALYLTKANVALVPYDNQKDVAPGSPVYDCRLSFIICRKVGQVDSIFVGEQHATNPIFRTDIRGFLVKMTLTNPESAKSRTLFIGGKPLWF